MVATAATPDARPLAPRIELFCRVVAAGGVSLAEAARRAGYAPGSARQRGSELWARDDVQARLGELSAEEEDRHQALVEQMRRQHDELYGKLVEQGQFPAASRLLVHRWRFEKEVGAVRAETRTERDRLREDLREEVRDELREELRGEVRAELVDELRKEMAELRQDMRVELRREMRAGAGPKTKTGAVTKHDIPARFDAQVPSGPVAGPLAGPLAVAAPHGAGSLKARLRDQPLPVPAGKLAISG
ncbi:hypothetical protein [Arenibaculum sp.]|uniref:hypothetical protein n=1 Tax=Arenibaculum sp. TaxID=2865862 RepID=UPI002E0F1537|nr:hypothetical protein [Arenibaculum sp.]